MREHAEIVIIGAGIVGCSAAYHLTRLGRRDVVVLEQGPLFTTGGSTSHAPGLVFQLNASRSVTRLAVSTTALYRGLSLDGQPCFYDVGSIEIATTPERWEELKRKLGHSMSWGLQATLLSPAEVAERIPLLRTDRLYGGLSVPSDGIAKAVRAAEALAREATARGAAFHDHCPVTGVEVAGGRVRAVLTPHGRITADQVLLCAGIWGPRIGAIAGVSIPLTPVQHQYVRSTPLPELAGEAREVVHPILRHQDHSMYFRQHADCYGVGSYRHEPLLYPVADIPTHDATEMPSVLPFTPEHFQPALAEAKSLLPALAGAGFPYQINGMFSFTPDGQSLLGESPDVRGFWVAEAIWVTHGGGAGEAIAAWMTTGTPGLDLREADLNRFHAHAMTRDYVAVRGAQQYREVYDIIHPLQQMEEPRGLRRGPFHRRHEELGAVFFESAGWERPQWFAANQWLLEGKRIPGRTGWTARYWSPICGVEHLATREGVALFDLSPFTKLEIVGSGALQALQFLSTNNLDVAVGKVVYTTLVNDRGGIQSDLTITRLAPERFLVVTGGAGGPRDLAWIRLHLPTDGSVHLTDVTSAYCCLGVWGPRARDLVGRVSHDDLSSEAFPYFSARTITIGYVPALAIRVSYAGELGWEIYTPPEFGLSLWDTLWEAGEGLGLVAAGGGAFDSLRLEKGYRLWGADIHTDYNPFEAGLGFAVRLKKGDFLGREALLRAREQGLSRTLSCLTLDDPSVVLMGKEPLLDGDQILGYVTSANFGYSIGQSIVYGYLPVDASSPGTRLAVQFFGRRFGATVVKDPLFDPAGDRLRA